MESKRTWQFWNWASCDRHQSFLQDGSQAHPKPASYFHFHAPKILSAPSHTQTALAFHTEFLSGSLEALAPCWGGERGRKRAYLIHIHWQRIENLDIMSKHRFCKCLQRRCELWWMFVALCDALDLQTWKYDVSPTISSTNRPPGALCHDSFHL